MTCEDLSNMHNLRNVIKILGIYFDGNDKERDDLNFRETLKSIKKSLNLWKWRGLSLLRRIQIAQKKLSDKYPHSAVDWEKVYSLSFCS